MSLTGTLQQLAGWAGLAALAFVAFATLSPIALRPKLARIGIEHFGAFAVIGFLFALAFPRHVAVVALILIGAAALLEAGQLLVPGRHGRAADAAVKIGGAVAGIALAWAANALVLPRLE